MAVCRQWSLPVICYVPSSVVQGGFTSHKIQICDVFETGCAVFYPLPRSLKIERCLRDGARGGGGGVWVGDPAIFIGGVHTCALP